MRLRLGFTRAEGLAGFYAVVALLHIVGWGLYLVYSRSHPALLGLGFAAYMLGLRHAFDADHIAAVDDTVRYLRERGQKPLGIGFFFSLGHSSVVLAMAIATVFAAQAVRQYLPHWQEWGGIIGAGVSGAFLWLVGGLNLLVVWRILHRWRTGEGSAAQHDHLDQMLSQRGLLNRLFGGWARRFITHSWQMYPLGVLFGLGFDTASEVSLLAMAAGAAAGQIPFAAVLSLPLLFAAGMSALDTTDGVLMNQAYDWAFVNPARKVFYNLTITALSVAVALVIGTIEWLQVVRESLQLDGRLWSRLATLDLGVIGYVIVALFLAAWVVAVALWKLLRMDECAPADPVHRHEHLHTGGVRHSHRHFH